MKEFFRPTKPKLKKLIVSCQLKEGSIVVELVPDIRSADFSLRDSYRERLQD